MKTVWAKFPALIRFLDTPPLPTPFCGRPTILKMDMGQVGRQSKMCGICVSAYLR